MIRLYKRVRLNPNVIGGDTGRVIQKEIIDKGFPLTGKLVDVNGFAATVYFDQPRITLCVPIGSLEYDDEDKGKSALDTQIGGDHYKKMAFQPVLFIRKNKLGFCTGNVVKYTVRAEYEQDKGAKREDLLKARHYIDIELELLDD